jgi:two-component system sensor histidine kinase ChvG
VRVFVKRGKGEVLARVEDDGPGIPPDNLETVFERFYTSRPKGAAFGGNSGLGLAIARQIIEAHGGRIWAENRYAGDRVVGASFRVALPLA